MDKETYEALKRIIQALESGNTDFLGKELKLTNSWIDEVSKDYDCKCEETCVCEEMTETDIINIKLGLTPDKLPE